jgi:hypothetical protein
MPPEQPPYLVILDTSFRDHVLVGRVEYVKPAETRMSVRWGIGTPPTGYTREGSGVVFVAHQSSSPPPPDEHAAIRKDNGSYSYQEGLHGAKWLMLVMILPRGRVLGDGGPAPDGTCLFGDRLAVYWRLSPEPGIPEFVKVKWSLRRTSDVGKGLQASEAITPLPFDSAEEPTFGVFVSYRRGDDGWAAGRIKDWLSDSLGKNSVFRDTDSIRPGMDFRKEIDEAVGKCRVMLVVIGKNWFDRKKPKGKRRMDRDQDWPRIEIESALQRHRLIIPVMLDGEDMLEGNSLPDSLRELAFRQYYELRHNSFERDVKGLIDHLRKHIRRV